MKIQLSGVTEAAGNLARPFSIYASSLAASIATVLIAWHAKEGKIELFAAAAFIAAVWGGVGALYWGKVWERREEAKANATVAVEQAKSTPPAPAPGTANIQAAADVTVAVTDGAPPVPPDPQNNIAPWDRK